MAHDNPWGLTFTEQATVQAYITEGSLKAAALSMGRADTTINAHMAKVKSKMGVRTAIHAIIEYDRWHRARPAAKS